MTLWERHPCRDFQSLWNGSGHGCPSHSGYSAGTPSPPWERRPRRDFIPETLEKVAAWTPLPQELNTTGEQYEQARKPWRPVPPGPAGGKTAPGDGRHQCLLCADGGEDRLQGHLSLRRRSGERLLRAAGSGHDQHERCAGRRGPHYLGHGYPAAGGYRHRLGRCLQYRAHHQGDDQGGRSCGAYGGSGGAEALRPPAQQGAGVHGRDGGPDQGGRGRQDGPGFRHDGAHGRLWR